MTVKELIADLELQIKTLEKIDENIEVMKFDGMILNKYQSFHCNEEVTEDNRDILILWDN